MHLLCIIKIIVHLLWASKRSGSGMWWRRMESFILPISTSDSTSAHIIDGVIEHSFSLCLFDVPVPFAMPLTSLDCCCSWFSAQE